MMASPFTCTFRLSRVAHILFGTTVVALLHAGCAGHSVPVATGRIDQPRASWQITAAPNDVGNQRPICRSDVEDVCVVEASRDNRPVFASVAVYLYPAGEKTVYKGAFLSGFMGGSGHETKVDYEIDPARQPTAFAAFGRVTSQPGEYEFRIALFGEVPGRTDPHQFAKTIHVRVVPPAGARATL
jgi:hypothetical protein